MWKPRRSLPAKASRLSKGYIYACTRLCCKNLHTHLAPVSMRHEKVIAQDQLDRREGPKDTIYAVSPQDCLTWKSATPCHTFVLLPVTKTSNVSTRLCLPFPALWGPERLNGFRRPEVELSCDYDVGVTTVQCARGTMVLEFL